MVVEISHLEVVLMMDCGGVHCSGVCTVPGNLLLSEASTSEMAIDGQRPPYTMTSDIKHLVYI
jgi:hypothetical protein